MKKRFTEQQIVAILREGEAGIQSNNLQKSRLRKD